MMGSIQINDELIEHMSWLSRIRITEEEKEKMKKEIELLINYINDVLAIDVDEEEEYLYPSIIHTREDVIKEDEEKGRKLLEGALLDKGFVRAPRVVKKK